MTEKLQKVLAAAGLGSRREMERWIEEGRITVNGKPATLGDRVSAQDRIAVDGRLLTAEERATQSIRVLLYNKPEGEICTRDDPEGRVTVFSKLPKLQNERWVAIGRLDINTSGLLLFTTDGELANKLMHPSQQVEREYSVRVRGDIDDGVLQRLTEGVLLEDGIAKFSAIVPGGGTDDGSNRWFYVTLAEGRNREVRRLWESQGIQVSRLKRVRYGQVTIPPVIRRGQYMELDKKTVHGLYQLAGLPPKPVHAETLDEKLRLERQRRKVVRNKQQKRVVARRRR
ncbi:MAG: 23S rRNA pseudouridine(2605) synthase RluB [Gammaproteobacteria bacterium]|nr:MAG: 23S rRNA pseudouridine(2605) synthase RluB [Gammaproteobacteria bacterium]